MMMVQVDENSFEPAFFVLDTLLSAKAASGGPGRLVCWDGVRRGNQ